jgi:asparagine synthase (glutamine-hydrolysing)
LTQLNLCSAENRTSVGPLARSLAKRALADRLPQAVLNETKKGYQAVDWHEGLTAARAEVARSWSGWPNARRQRGCWISSG